MENKNKTPPHYVKLKKIKMWEIKNKDAYDRMHQNIMDKARIDLQEMENLNLTGVKRK